MDALLERHNATGMTNDPFSRVLVPKTKMKIDEIEDSGLTKTEKKNKEEERKRLENIQIVKKKVASKFARFIDFG